MCIEGRHRDSPTAFTSASHLCNIRYARQPEKWPPACAWTRPAEAASRVLPRGATREHFARGGTNPDEPAGGLVPGAYPGGRARGAVVQASRTPHLPDAVRSGSLRARHAAGARNGPPSRQVRRGTPWRSRRHDQDRSRQDLRGVPAAPVPGALSSPMPRHANRDSDGFRGAEDRVAPELRARSRHRRGPTSRPPMSTSTRCSHPSRC